MGQGGAGPSAALEPHAALSPTSPRKALKAAAESTPGILLAWARSPGIGYCPDLPFPSQPAARTRETEPRERSDTTAAIQGRVSPGAPGSWAVSEKNSEVRGALFPPESGPIPGGVTSLGRSHSGTPRSPFPATCDPVTRVGARGPTRRSSLCQRPGRAGAAVSPPLAHLWPGSKPRREREGSVHPSS